MLLSVMTCDNGCRFGRYKIIVCVHYRYGISIIAFHLNGVCVGEGRYESGESCLWFKDKLDRMGCVLLWFLTLCHKFTHILYMISVNLTKCIWNISQFIGNCSNNCFVNEKEVSRNWDKAFLRSTEIRYDNFHQHLINLRF